MAHFTCFLTLGFFFNFFGFFYSGCHNNKSEPSEVVNQKKEEKDDKSDNGIIEPILVAVDTSISTEYVSNNDSLLIYIEKTPCFGRCPTYKAYIYKKGYVFFEGIRFVEPEGKNYAHISKKKITELLNYASDISYFNMRDKYDATVTDLPSIITSVSMDGKRKRIENRFDGPDQLRGFQDLLHQTLINLDYTPITEK